MLKRKLKSCQIKHKAFLIRIIYMKLVSCEIKERIEPKSRKSQLTKSVSNVNHIQYTRYKLVSCEIKERIEPKSRKSQLTKSVSNTNHIHE